jgi:type IV secretory pathway VirB10-like protein
VSTPRDIEQQVRDELANRLFQLENMVSFELFPLHLKVRSVKLTLHSSLKLVTSDESHKISSPIKDSNGVDILAGSLKLSSPVKTKEQIEEDEQAVQAYKERKLRAKKKREEKQQREMQKILDEKRQIEEELEELKNNLLTEKQQPPAQQAATAAKPLSADSNNADGEDELDKIAGKKLSRLKKRYEKKLAVAKEEIEFLRDVSPLLSSDFLLLSM